MTVPPPSPIAGFRTFWMGGFEAACHVNQFGVRMDLIAGTAHDVRVLADYQMLKDSGIGVVRDAMRWHLIDTGGDLNFSSFLPFLKASIEAKIQPIWTLCHYGMPDGLDPFSPEFIPRFRRFAAGAARLIREHTSEIPYYTPFNELSFFTWAASRNGMFPFAIGRDDELKRQLVRAVVEVCHELRAVDPRCRLVYPEPIINVVPPLDRPDLAGEAHRYTESQFDAWDMIAGLESPELGGSPDLLDIVGMNFYHSNQWELGAGRLAWEQVPRDPRWMPLSSMMERIWQRYRRPLFLAETSHIGIGRGDWITEVAEETQLALQRGVPVEGVCLFPIIDRYDWGDSTHWHNSGLWDLAAGTMDRVLNPAYAAAFIKARLLLGSL